MAERVCRHRDRRGRSPLEVEEAFLERPSTLFGRSEEENEDSIKRDKPRYEERQEKEAFAGSEHKQDPHQRSNNQQADTRGDNRGLGLSENEEKEGTDDEDPYYGGGDYEDLQGCEGG